MLARTNIHAVVTFWCRLPVHVDAGEALLLVRPEATTKALLIAVPVGWYRHSSLRSVAVSPLAIGWGGARSRALWQFDCTQSLREKASYPLQERRPLLTYLTLVLVPAERLGFTILFRLRACVGTHVGTVIGVVVILKANKYFTTFIQHAVH